MTRYQLLKYDKKTPINIFIYDSAKEDFKILMRWEEWEFQSYTKVVSQECTDWFKRQCKKRGLIINGMGK